jgi:hypothetical protein
VPRSACSQKALGVIFRKSAVAAACWIQRRILIPEAQAHCKRHIYNSDVHELLETEERLALQVRTLDSTMQTLVLILTKRQHTAKWPTVIPQCSTLESCDTSCTSWHHDESRSRVAWETVRPQTVLWSNSGLASLGSKEQDLVSLQCRVRALISPKTASHR